MSPDTRTDIVLYGATGFTGRVAARYLAEHAPAGVRWALAGRNADKLAALRASLGPECVGIPLVVADSADAAAVEAMVRHTRVVMNTAGPFARYGTPVVEACVRHGADYVDITGETPWVRDLIDDLHDEAQAAGRRIVPMCGMDSVPSDLGAFMMARHLQEEHGEDCVSVRAVFRLKGGGLNGGTLASALEGQKDPDSRGRLQDRILLNPPGRRGKEDRARAPSDATRPKRDPELGWTTTFVMSAINTRAVRRSAALFADEGRGYGEDFRYREVLNVRTAAQAYGMNLALGATMAIGHLRPVQALTERLGPKPGEGPSEEAMRRGAVRVEYFARGTSGREVRGRLQAEGDAGNLFTTQVLAECALALALDRERLPARAGILTPATAFEGVLLDRLRASGQRWAVPAEET